MQQVDKQTLVENIAPEAVFVHMGATLVRDKEIEVLQQKRYRIERSRYRKYFCAYRR